MQLPQLIERSAFVRSRRSGSSTVAQDSHAEPRIVDGAAELVENKPRPQRVHRVERLERGGGWMVDTVSTIHPKINAFGDFGRQAVYLAAPQAVYLLSIVYRLPLSTR